MNIEKFFEPYNNSSIVFDPIPSYSGYWDFEIENLIKNSKKENGVNLFQQFIEDIYLKKIGKIFNINVVSTIPIRLLSSPNEDNVGRCLKFSKIPLYSNLQLFLNQSIDLYGKDKENHYKYLSDLFNNLDNNEKLNEDFINALKEKLLKLKDIKENGFESVYHDAVMEDFDFEKKVYPNLEFNQYINSMYKITEQYINGLMNIGDFFEQKIDYNELYKCFNPDTFYLLFAKIIYEISLRTEEECNLLDNSYGYLNYYSNILEKIIAEEKNYNPKINYTLENGKRLRDYSRRQFQLEFSKLIKRHPEAKMVAIPNLNGDNSKYKDIDLIEKIALLYDEDVVVNWTFLPKGEKIRKGESSNSSEYVIKEQKDNNKLVNETNMRISILENSGYMGTPVKGLDTFSGYFAFIYPNGKVILEKFWEDEECLKPAVGYATYVMQIDNFIELSKKSKIELIEYIKTIPEIGVKRIFHTSINNWQRNLNNEIEGTYRLEDAIEFINGLKTGDKKHE